MKVILINKSDSTGGAAVVSRRLMEALRQQGHDARMLVCEKLSDSPYVETASSPAKIRLKFLIERLKVFVANGFKLTTLFKIDTGEEGLPLWRHPLVKAADAILINWVNQGMLSLKGVAKILELGKPVVWTMHDMWEMTGICHHAHNCRHYVKECGECPLLGKKASENDLSHDVWLQKESIYGNPHLMKKMAFVAVSNWLKKKAFESSLLKEQRVEVIPNPFRTEPDMAPRPISVKPRIRLLFGAARLDDPIKGLETFKEASRIIMAEYPEMAKNLEIAFFGNVKDENTLQGFGLPIIRLGVIKGERALRKVYEDSSILVSSSSYETLPGTLVEAQAYGCIPVAFDRGGQKDIVEDGITGFITDYSENPQNRARNLVEVILKACSIMEDSGKLAEMRTAMKENVKIKFSPQEVAGKYVKLIDELKGIE